MAKKYVLNRTAYFYEAATGEDRSMVLIYGDEVDVSGNETNGRLKATFRGRNGFIKAQYLGDQPALELYFIDVGQGDSTFIVTPGRKKILIDGGINKRALGFLSWKYRLDQPTNFVDIDVLILTHADADHIAGLIPILKNPQINVKRILHSGIATFRPGILETELGNLAMSDGIEYLTTRQNSLSQFSNQDLSTEFSDWCQAIEAKLAPDKYEAVSSTTAPISLGDPLVKLEVLGPVLYSVNAQSGYRWLSDLAHTINGNSVVLRLTYNNVHVLLTGDINAKGSKLLLASPGITTRLASHVFKVPHHGSNDFDPDFLAAVRPQISIVSSGDEPDHGHPRANLLGAIGRVGRSNEPLLFSTEIAATFSEINVPPAPGDTETSGGSTVADQRHVFKQSLHGMINVRSDGSNLFAARRVMAGYWWEAYGPIAAGA